MSQFDFGRDSASVEDEQGRPVVGHSPAKRGIARGSVLVGPVLGQRAVQDAALIGVQRVDGERDRRPEHPRAILGLRDGGRRQRGDVEPL